MDAFRVAATQLDTRLGDVEHNLEAHARLAQDAAAAGCALVVFPELSATGHSGDPEVTRAAEEHDGPIFDAVRELARSNDVVIGYGFCEAFRGTHYNSYSLVGPDGLLGLQRKVHASYDEFFHVRLAYEWAVVDLGFCRVGTAICHDSDFFESWRVLALKGTEVVLLPHATRIQPAGGGDLTFDGRGREASAEEIGRAQDELLAERPHPPRRHDVLARDNAVFAVHSGQVGFDGHSTHVGGGYVLGPDGSLLARTKAGPTASLAVADLDPAQLEHTRENPWYALRKRRPEAYEELTATV